tara:strand:+ start:2128 stop:2574 length:447 start_codon:yes stop_codon:yes gene_type:complete
MANYVSDKRVVSSNAAISTTAKRKEYRDLDLSLTLHPIRKDITPLRDDEAIRNSIRNLLSTNRFERPFQPNLAGNLKDLLFEPATQLIEVSMQMSIESVLVEHEPRIKLIGVASTFNEAQNAYSINVKYIIKDLDQVDEVDVKLRRLR